MSTEFTERVMEAVRLQMEEDAEDAKVAAVLAARRAEEAK